MFNNALQIETLSETARDSISQNQALRQELTGR